MHRTESLKWVRLCGGTSWFGIADEGKSTSRRSRDNGAGLDVFEHEPTDEHCPLFRFDNVVVSPHIAGNDVKSMDDMVIEAAQCVIDLTQGRWPKSAVINSELKNTWRW